MEERNEESQKETVLSAEDDKGEGTADSIRANNYE